MIERGVQQVVSFSKALRILCAVLGLWLLCLASPAFAAADIYRLYFDSDANPNTGCSATLTDRYGSVTAGGFEYRLSISVDASGHASTPTLAACEGSGFGPDAPAGQAAAAQALRAAGIDQLAQLELSVPASAVGATPATRVVLAANGDYIRSTKAGPGAAPITLGNSLAATGATAVPALAPWLLAALATVLAVLGAFIVRRRALHYLPLLLMAVMGTGIAAGVLVIDGNTDDWQGIAPIAIDFTGDQVPGSTDLFSLSAQIQGAAQGSDLFLRIDSIAGANPLQDPSPLDASSTQPRFLTHPSLNLSVGQAWNYAVQASSAAGQTLSASLTQAPGGLQLTGSAPSQQLSWTPSAAGTYWVSLKVQDGSSTQTQTFPLYVSDDRNLPADPATTATAVAPVGFTSFADRTAFLYQGATPVQTGVASGAIDPVTATVVKGKVSGYDGQPLPGVTVRIAGHPEWGQTRTRADGNFDLAAGGGGWLTVDFQKTGYMRVQRRIQAPWRDFAFTPDVVLLPYGAQYSPIDLTAGTPQLYWGAGTNDGRGQRRTSVYFPAGTQAQMVMPDGSTQPLPQMTLRATEYTLGAAGPQAMPAGLPMSVGYTWAANFTADEAETAGAKSIQFSKPVVTYVDNFIDMPVGTAVPVGWYDFDKTAWIGEDNGRIVKILSVDGQGQAVLQVTTDERPATAQELQALGIDGDELKQLGGTRAVGSVLWRVAVTHFSPWDCNYPWGPPPDVEPPPTDQPPTDPPPPPPCPPNMCCNTGAGCDVMFTQRALGQDIDLPGTSLALYYRSDRIDKGPFTFQVRATDASPPASLQRIEISATVAGVKYLAILNAGGWTPNQMVSFTWNGRDIYGRLQPNGAVAQIKVSYIYRAVYYPVAADNQRAWDQLYARASGGGGGGGVGITGDPSANLITVSSSYTLQLPPVGQPSPEVGLAGAGGWALQGLRMYDPEAQRVYEGGGRIWDAKLQPRSFTAVTSTLAGTTMPTSGNSAVGADGALYYSDTGAHQIRRVWLYGARKGQMETLAGTGAAGFSGDGGSAAAAQLNQPTALALAPDGGIVFMDSGNARLRRIAADGTIQTLSQPIWASRIAVAGDMSIFVLAGSNQLQQISPSGYLSVLNVNGEMLVDLTSAPTGQVWLSTSGGLYQFTDVGTLNKMSSTGYASGLLADAQGGVFFNDIGNALSYISRAGDKTPLGQNFTNAWTNYSNVWVLGVAPGSDVIASSFVYNYGNSGFTLGILGAGLPAFGDPAYRVARSDGNTIDEFDVKGRPIATRSTFGGQALLTYGYGPTGQLTSITDSYGNTTTLARDGSGLLTAVTGPFGQVTTLSYNGSRQLTGVTQPGGLSYAMQYASPSSGLLTSYQDARGNADQFSYDASGLLVTNADPIGGGWSLNTSGDTTDNWSGNRTYTVNAQSAEGRASSYVTTAKTWDYTTVATASDGTQTTRDLMYGSTLTETQPSGAVSTTYLSTDPRLGGAVLRSQTVNLQGGYNLSFGVSRSLSNAYAADAWQNPQNWSESTTLNNRSWVTAYQGAGYFTRTTPMGRKSGVQLDAHQQPQSATLSNGLALNFSYDARGQLTGLGSTDGTHTRSASLGWNASGRIASLTNALNQSESFDYDTAGRLVTSTLADGRALHYTWDGAGNLTSLTTPAGVVHSFSYNAVQQPAGYSAPGSGATQWNYDRDRLLTSIVRPGGSLTFQRAASGRVSSLSDSAGYATQLSYDGAARLTKASTQDGQAIAFDYGGTALLKGIDLTLQGTTASLGLNYESVGYGFINPRIGQVTLTAGGQSQSITSAYDGDGLLTSNGPLVLGRDPTSGQLTSLVLNNLTTSEQRDAWGQLSSSRTYSLQTVFSPELDNNRQAVRTLVAALGTRLAGNINTRGDCVIWHPTAPLCPSLPTPPALPLPPNSAKAKEVPIGCNPNPTNAADAAQAHLPWPPQPPQWTGFDTCQHTLQGQIQNLLQFIDTGAPADIGSALQYLITDFSSGPSHFINANEYPSVPGTYNTSYIDATAQSLIDQINATLATWQANQTNWQTALGQTHNRDALGRITQTQEQLLGATVPTAKSYGYDTAGRLSSATIGTSTTTWGYDANGNRTTENGATIATYDSQDRLNTWKGNSYQYNAAGDLSQKATPAGTTHYSYDNQGGLRQVKLASGGTIDYAIDPAGRRTGKRVNGQLQWQLVWLNNLRPIARLKADNTLEAVYYYGGKPNVPEAMDKGGKTYRIISDQSGSVRLVIDANSGEVAQQMDYDVWGKVINDTNPGFQPFGFAGGLYDPDTQLTRFGARDYDAETGRWTAKDPILFAGGDSNLYGYVLGDPVNWVDPYGLWALGDPLPQDLVDAVTGFGDAFLIPIIVRDVFDIGGVNRCSGAYAGGMIVGTIWGFIPFGLEEAAAYGGTKAGMWINSNRYFRIGPGRWGKDMLPRMSSPYLPGDGHVLLTNRLPKPPPAGALTSQCDCR